MNKKLVWVIGIVLVVSLLIPMNVLGWPYYIQSDTVSNSQIQFEWDGSIVNLGSVNLVCSNPTTAKPTLRLLQVSGDSASTGSGPYYVTRNVIQGCNYAPKYVSGSPVSSAELATKYGTVTLRANSGIGCIGYTNIKVGTNQAGSQDINANFILGGYIYVNKKTVNPLSVFSSSDSYANNQNNRNVDVSNYFAVYNVDQRNPASSTLGSAVDLDMTNTWDYLFTGCEGNGDQCYTKGNTFLDPGIYYLITYIGFDNSNDNNNDWGYAVLGYGSYSSATGLSTITNGLSNSDYTIYSTPLSRSQIISQYTSDVVDSAFCQAVQGTKDSRFSLTKSGCCRPENNGAIAKDVATGKDYICENNDWKITQYDTQCKSLAAAQGVTTPSFNQVVLSSYAGATDYYAFMTNTKDGSDGCCGDDGLGDYGYIATVDGKKSYLCYQNNDDEYSWIPAGADSYIIKDLNNSNNIFNYVNTYIGKQNTVTDVISNSQEWFYCNANTKSKLLGKAIANEKTFEPRSADAKPYCSEVFTAYFDGQEFVDQISCVGSTVPCCIMGLDDNGNPAPKEYYNSNLDCECYIPGSSTPVSLPTGYDNTLDSGATKPGEQDIEQEECVINPSLPQCVYQDVFDYNLACNVQKSPDGKKIYTTNQLCDTAVNYCKDGVFKTNIDSKDPAKSNYKCCYGENAICTAKPTSVTMEECSKTGEIYPISPNVICQGNNYADIGNTGNRCCFSQVYTDVQIATKSIVSPNSSICFMEGDNNIISQCCYDSTCANKDYYSLTSISDFNKRVLTKGSTLHTIENFDKMPRPTGNQGPQIIKDLSRQYVIPGNSQTNIVSLRGTTLTGYSYLEFDALFYANLEIRINGQLIGKLLDYSTNGEGKGVWHRISIPVSKLGVLQLNTIRFYNSEPVTNGLMIDDIILVPETSIDLSSNTKNYYCTGGYMTWVPDLDPDPAKITSSADYGPYMFACRAIGSYSWTGTKCCGDDTRLNNYGEHYADDLAGCFDGSSVFDNTRVSDAKGYTESTIAARDELKNYEYAGILYLDKKFIGCQLSDYEKSTLTISTNGNNGVTSLISENIVDQCAVRGDYYCSDGVWRKLIVTNEGADIDPASGIELKTVPSGTELIKNGFRQ